MLRLSCARTLPRWSLFCALSSIITLLPCQTQGFLFGVPQKGSLVFGNARSLPVRLGHLRKGPEQGVFILVLPPETTAATGNQMSQEQQQGHISLLAIINLARCHSGILYPSHMKQHSKMLKLLIVSFGLLFLGCLNPKNPGAGSVQRSPLLGKWTIVEQTTTPLMIIPLCRSIRTGMTVQFTQTTFEVYVDASGRPCNTYGYKTTNNHISFIKGDMLWLCTYELTPSVLKLISTNFFLPDDSEKPGLGTKPSAINQVVVITLRRK